MFIYIKPYRHKKLICNAELNSTLDNLDTQMNSTLDNSDTQMNSTLDNSDTQMNSTLDNSDTDNENNFNAHQPLVMSNQLCVFFNLPLKSKKSLFELRKQVMKYIHKKKLNNLQDGRKFYLDENLKKITIDCYEMNYFRLYNFLFKQLTNT